VQGCAALRLDADLLWQWWLYQGDEFHCGAAAAAQSRGHGGMRFLAPRVGETLKDHLGEFFEIVGAVCRQQAVVAYFDESLGQDMLEESPDEFGGWDGGVFELVGFLLLVLERDGIGISPEDTAV
jgi:hypothetical protein